MSAYVVAYDIHDTKRRAAVARILVRHGARVQLSVFELFADKQELLEIRRAIAAHLGATDAFDIFPIDLRSPERRLSWRQQPRQWEAVRLL